MKGFEVYTQKKHLNRSVLDKYNFKVWSKKVNFTNIQTKLLYYGFSSMELCIGSIVHLFIIFKNVQSLHLKTFKLSEFVTAELKKYYIWRADLGNISKKTNKCSHYYNYLNAESLRVILVNCKFMAYFNSPYI